MRSVMYGVSVMVSGLLLLGCGQSGALHLPNDPNYDKRAKYLLYKPAADTAVKQPAASTAEPAEVPTPATTESTTTP